MRDILYSRRSFVRFAGFGLASLVLPYGGQAKGQSVQPPGGRPNVLFIMSDDHELQKALFDLT